MNPVQFMVTAAGLDALVNAGSGTTDRIKIASVGLTESAFLMAPTILSVPGEFKRITALSGVAASETIIHMTAQDSSTDVYELRGMGLYLEDGTLFAIYSQPSPLFRKVEIAFYLMALDISFADGAAGDIVFGDTTFLFPPATETIKGVAEIATPAEAAGRTDHERIITPLTLGLQLLIERAETDTDLMALANGWQAMMDALLARTITGGGLVTGGGDLTASRMLSVLAASGADVEAGTATDRAVTPQGLHHRLGIERGETDADLTALANGWQALLNALAARTITGGGLVTGGGALTASRVLSVLAASGADVEAGTATDRAVTPQGLHHRLGIERGETDADFTALTNAFDALLAAIVARTITGGGLVTGGGDLTASRQLTVQAASGADVEAGTATDRAVTPQGLHHRLGIERQAIDAIIAAIVARTITGAGLVTGGGSLAASRTLTVQAASAADVLAGTATDRAVTPAALAGLARSLLTNGYARIPGTQLILQWGKFTAISNGSTSHLFPMSFPTECFAVVPAGGVSGGVDSQDNPPVLVDSSISLSGFTMFSADDSSAGIRYLALGI